jgi:hypothetical protein
MMIPATTPKAFAFVSPVNAKGLPAREKNFGINYPSENFLATF